SSDSVYQPAMYTEFEAQPWVGTRIVPGLRVDYSKNTKSWDLEPRLVVRQDVTGHRADASAQGPGQSLTDPRTTLTAGIGALTQPPLPQQTDPVFGTPGLVNERSMHYDVGVERQLTRQIDASLDAFYKQLEYLARQGLGSTGSGDVYG